MDEGLYFVDHFVEVFILFICTSTIFMFLLISSLVELRRKFKRLSTNEEICNGCKNDHKDFFIVYYFM